MAGTKRKAPDDAAEMDGRPRADCALGLPTDRPQHDRPNPGQPGRLEAGAPADDYFRHLYASEPDFRRLAKRDSHFAAVLQDNGQLDFSDPKATMQLTRTLLGLDFGLKLDLPEDRLCPPVPNRHNYILWLKI
jgi:23S rRNA (adenine1618-N6)-methyltransferase